MPDIEKLKQAAEEARNEAIREISYIHRVDLYSPSSIADALIRATALHLRLQAAEKEAEAQKHRVDVANATMQFGLACKKEPRLEKAFIGAMLSVRDKFGTDPAPIADNCARSHPHEDMTPECEKKSIEAKAANADTHTWIKWEGGECPIPGIENWEWKGRDGRISKEVKYLAEKLRWRHCDSCSDIIAYRIISPAADRVGEP